MKISRTLTDTERQTLEQLRAGLLGALKDIESHHGNVRACHSRLEKLEREHRKLENSAQGGSAEASAKLIGVIDQKRREHAKIEGHEASGADCAFVLRPHVVDTQTCVSAICTADITRQIEDVFEASIGIYFANIENARRLTRESDALQKLGWFFNRQIGHSVAELTEQGSQYIGVIENLLAGKDVWEVPAFRAPKSKGGGNQAAGNS